MSIYFEKARELGDLILGSEESLALADARALFLADDKAIEKMEEFNAYRGDIQESINKGAMSQEEYDMAISGLNGMADALKQVPVIGELVKAEEEFNAFVNKIMNVLKMTISGGADEEGCGGDCGGCPGCK